MPTSISPTSMEIQDGLHTGPTAPLSYLLSKWKASILFSPLVVQPRPIQKVRFRQPSRYSFLKPENKLPPKNSLAHLLIASKDKHCFVLFDLAELHLDF